MLTSVPYAKKYWYLVEAVLSPVCFISSIYHLLKICINMHMFISSFSFKLHECGDTILAHYYTVTA